MNKLVAYFSLDRTKLFGIWNRHDIQTKGCFILCHGLKTDKEEYGVFESLSNVLFQWNYDSFRFDFRGHGQSEGTTEQIIYEGLKSDLEATISLVRNSGYREIYILGASFGASVLSLMDYAKFPEVKRLIMWSGSIDFDKGNPLGSLGDNNYKKALQEGSITIKSKTTGKNMTFSKFFMEETRELKPQDKIKQINIPILFIHGTEDETTPYEVNRRLSAKCKKGLFALIPNATHGFHQENEFVQATQYLQVFLEMDLLDERNELIDKFCEL